MDMFDRRRIYLRAGTNQYVVGCHLVDRVRNKEEVQFPELDETLQCIYEDIVLKYVFKAANNCQQDAGCITNTCLNVL